MLCGRNLTRPAVKPRICVLGSINMDLQIRCELLPERGQTVSASASANVSGGKGANQAVAAARLGADVRMIGRVGDDPFADELIENLRQEGVDTRHVHRTPGSSGYAVVAVDASGENQIIVVPGANARVSVADVEAARDVIAESDVLLLQLEVPAETVAAAIRLAAEVDTKVMLDPAPAPAVWLDDFDRADFLCPNESEAAAIAGQEVTDVASALSAGRSIRARTEATVLVTCGMHGAIVCSGDEPQHHPASSIEPVDTTGAGDTFAAAFAVHFSQYRDPHEATRFANCAATLSCGVSGAQAGMPTWDEVMQVYEQPGA